MEMVVKRMLALRTGVNISQVKLSKALSISQAAVPDTVLLKYSDYFDVSADYLLGRTDKPEGILYNHQPDILKKKIEQSEEFREFIEACFNPHSPMNAKLKEMIFNLAKGGDA